MREFLIQVVNLINNFHSLEVRNKDDVLTIENKKDYPELTKITEELQNLLEDNKDKIQELNVLVDGEPVLHKAVFCKNSTILEILLQYEGIDVNIKDENGNNILHKVIITKEREVHFFALLNFYKKLTINYNEKTPNLKLDSLNNFARSAFDLAIKEKNELFIAVFVFIGIEPHYYKIDYNKKCPDYASFSTVKDQKLYARKILQKYGEGQKFLGDELEEEIEVIVYEVSNKSSIYKDYKINMLIGASLSFSLMMMLCGISLFYFPTVPIALSISVIMVSTAIIAADMILISRNICPHPQGNRYDSSYYTNDIAIEENAQKTKLYSRRREQEQEI